MAVMKLGSWLGIMMVMFLASSAESPSEFQRSVSSGPWQRRRTASAPPGAGARWFCGRRLPRPFPLPLPPLDHLALVHLPRASQEHRELPHDELPLSSPLSPYAP